ncbi:hypothetical protein ARMGADRAFT_1029595 [Armillaria gallica]|uniref:Uncharacterized protein n=1 Tax=Armillaria gallica TaxID=47427 RepID=A0A2H3DUN1_ARMGA|nr:hypothetical protein ARMGADRAFT_1029595 [Armillaria gallica]
MCSGLGEWGQDQLGVEKVIGDIVKRKCANDTEEAKESEECGTKEHGKNDSGDCLGVRVVVFSNGEHIEKGVKSFELIVKPGLGMNKQAQSKGCFAFRQSPLDAAKSAAVPVWYNT